MPRSNTSTERFSGSIRTWTLLIGGRCVSRKRSEYESIAFWQYSRRISGGW